MKRYIKSSIYTTDKNLQKKLLNIKNNLTQDLENMGYNYLKTNNMLDEAVDVNVSMNTGYDERFDDACVFNFSIEFIPSSHTEKAFAYIQRNINFSKFCKTVDEFLEQKGFEIDYPCEHLTNTAGEFFCICTFEV